MFDDGSWLILISFNFHLTNAAELPTSSIVTVRRNAAVFSNAESIFFKF